MEKIKFPLSIRFSGPDLDKNGASILDIGESLIAIQRIIHKAYLINANRPFRRATVSKNTRRKLAMQIAERKPGSDLLHLDWILHEVLTPLPANLLSDLILLVGKSASLYVTGTITERLKALRMGESKIEDRQVDELALRLFTEMHDLVRRIGIEPVYSKKGKKSSNVGIEKIELYFSEISKPVILDEKVKKYVLGLNGEKVYGELESIVGVVDKAHTYNRNCAEVRTVNNFWVKVCMEEDMFDDLLEDLTTYKLHTFTFEGRAIYRVGRSIHWFNEFEAESYYL